MVSRKTYYSVYIALLVLLVVTIGIAFVPLGEGAFIIAMGIAITKALLVLIFFMHLKYDIGLVRLFAAAGFVWLLILFAHLLSDYFTRNVPHQTIQHTTQISVPEPATPQLVQE